VRFALLLALAQCLTAHFTDFSPNATACSVNGNPGLCVNTTLCNNAPSFVSFGGLCPNEPVDVECCVLQPSVSGNPPVPTGWAYMKQSVVTPAMTDWAVAILRDPVTFPRFVTVLRSFPEIGAVMARVEWHPKDFLNEKIHRGVSLFLPTNTIDSTNCLTTSRGVQA